MSPGGGALPAVSDVVRVGLGYFVRPVEETGGAPRVEPVLGYLVRHPRGNLLLDTGIGVADEETEQWYRPRRIPLADALARVGCALADVDVVANCHLHFDHCGGNALLAGRPVLAQRAELDLVGAEGYTVPGLVQHEGARFEVLDGESELWPGLRLLPTPGHSAGHQSVVVRCADGTVILAGQSHDHASEFAADALAVAAVRDGLAPPLPVHPPWMARLLDLDPRRVLFAHDQSVWTPA